MCLRCREAEIVEPVLAAESSDPSKDSELSLQQLIDLIASRALPPAAHGQRLGIPVN